jgi:hypothetical protein
MIEQPGRIRTGIEPAELDDLKNIRGIGPGIEARLHEGRVQTYAQLAQMTPEELAERVGDLIGMSAARVERQDWIGQAKRLAKESQDSETNETAALNRQHYAVFTIELLLGSDNSVRRTRLLHVQSQAEENWAGWDETRLVGFIKEESMLKTEFPQPVPVNTSPKVDEGDIPLKEKEITYKGMGKARLLDFGIFTMTDERMHRLVPGKKPFQIRLTLDFSHTDLPSTQTWYYHIAVYAKKVGEASPHQVIGQNEGILPLQDQVNLEVKGLTLLTGFYRLDTMVKVISRNGNSTQPALMTMTEGEFIQVC